MADTDLGLWHRVCLNTIVRKGRELDSERLRILPMGSRVRVQETCDRRVRIDMPVAGWCSLRSSNGDTILSPLQQQNDNDGQMTPSMSQGNEKKYYENYKESLIKKQKENEDATKLSKQLLEIQQQIAKAKQEITAQEELQLQVKELTHEREKLLQESQASSKNALDSLGIDPEHLEDAQSKLTARNETLQAEIAAAENFISACRTEVAELKNKLADGAQVQGDTADLRPGDVVNIAVLGVAIVRYFGNVEGQDGKFVGVELETNIGDTNGHYNGRTYFEVDDDCGMFLPFGDIKERLTPATLLQKLERVVDEIGRLESSRE